MSIFFNLPEDIIFDILSRVPTKTLLQFLCVCRSSPPLISHPCFINRHLSSDSNDQTPVVYYESLDNKSHFYSLMSPVTFQETLKLQPPCGSIRKAYRHIVGSNKGLICLFLTNFCPSVGTLILWNPSIHKYKILVGPHNVFHDFSHFLLAFGFVSRTLDFKVVNIVYHSKTNNDNTVLVYSLSTNSCETKQHLTAPCYFPRIWSDNVFVNGFVNWLVPYSHVIMSFDLDHERFQLLELPKNIVPGYSQLRIRSYGDDAAAALSLSLCASYFHERGEKSWDVWVMEDYGSVDSWKKLFVVSLPKPSGPPLLMKNQHQVLIVLNDGRLVLLDAIKNEVQDLNMQGSHRFVHAISYTASLALLLG